ncbi:MAG TPA: hypothetical protein VFN29_09045 [Chiayiivirga sp.]|nr:hypothetical protein [Chiayiivirga sp.]
MIALVGGWHSNSRVCFISFDIPIVLPHTEETIQVGRLCKHSIGTLAFIGMLTSDESRGAYEPRDIKAMVEVTPIMKVFVDGCGRVRAGAKYYKLDKDRFMNALDGLQYKTSERTYPPYPLPSSCWDEPPQ